MLFLGITGALFAALMVGVNTGITQQRYLDSTRSYKALLQDQYAAALNVRIQKVDQICHSVDDGAWIVGDGKRDEGDNNRWGASECVVLGRAIQITDGGDHDENGTAKGIRVSSIVGHLKSTAKIDDGTSDFDAIKAYNLILTNFDEETSNMDWGSSLTTLKDAAGGAPGSKLNKIILILRSPVSGALYTFYGEPSSSLDSIVETNTTSSKPQSELQTCISSDASGFLPKQMVTINPAIAGADAVSLDGGNKAECQ